jgi:hypothetical protein
MRVKKLRNKPCHCGSGLKYKNCHLKKENDETMKTYELDKELKDSYSKKKCMAKSLKDDKCSKKIIKAHTISKSANLKVIAKDGHVFSFKKSIQALHDNSFTYPIEKIGINNASVFNGFCAKHDKDLFSIIEDSDIIFSDEQIFMLAYRTVSNELYLKYASHDNTIKAKNYDKGLSLGASLLYQDFNENFMKHGVDLAVKDLENIKKKYDEYLIKKDFSNIKYYILLIDKNLEIVNSTGWIPTIDFKGIELANLNDHQELFNSLTINSISYENKGAILFSWLDIDTLSNDYSIQFIKSLHEIKNKKKSLAILHWLFECAENIYWSIDWWESINDEKKKKLMTNSSMNMELPNLSSFTNLTGLVNWNIIDIKTNIESLKS